MNILVTGSFDLLHSGHIKFLQTASTYGKLYVGIGSDASIEWLKIRPTVNTEKERLYMVKAVRYVEDAWVNTGVGSLDFALDLWHVEGGVDTLIVNEDQDFPNKREYCVNNGIEYIVLKRTPEEGLPIRSSTKLREYYGK